MPDRDASSTPVTGVPQAFDVQEVESLDRVAEAALQRWGIDGTSPISLINLSENATYFVDTPGGDGLVLRIGRPDYNSAAEVASELMWVEALAVAGAVQTPPVIRARGGVTAVAITVPELPGSRACAMFGRVAGTAPDEHGELVEPFRVLGGLAARIHTHGREWAPPTTFNRRRWSYETTIGETPSWGRWEDAIGVGPEERAELTGVCGEIRRRLAAYGDGPDRYGLVHADLRLGNTLWGDGGLYVIDFDDAGWSWLLWDLATALTFTEQHPQLGELVAAWLEGYTEISRLSSEVIAIVPTLIMLRRLHVLAWLGSHAYSTLAQAEGPAYLSDTRELAAHYLAGDGPGV